MADIDETNLANLGANETSRSVADNALNVTTDSAIIPKLTGVRVPGTFTLTTLPSLDFLDTDTGLGQVRNLVIKMLETDRSTGNFVQLDHKAFLEVTCNFNKFIGFNASNTTDGLDDAYQFVGITLTNNGAYNNLTLDDTKLVGDTQYVLDLTPSLIAGLGAPLAPTGEAPNQVAAKASYGGGQLISNWFPSGAVIIDLASHSSVSDIVDANRKVTVSTAEDSDVATYQVTNLHVGMTLFARITVNCSNVSGSPTLSAEATFDPFTSSGTVLGAMDVNGKVHNQVTIHLLNQEDFTKAQEVVIGLGDGMANENLVGSLTFQTVDNNYTNTAAQPGANDADVFSVTITLNNLGGADDNGSIGRSMIQGIMNSVAQSNNSDPHNPNNKLLSTFAITVDQIDYDTSSDFSGYMRALAAASTNEKPRPADMPIRDGERFIVQTPTTINLNITPFEYEMNGVGLQNNIAQFKLIDEMEVYAVLKHNSTATTPVLQTAADDNGPLPVLTVTA